MTTTTLLPQTDSMQPLTVGQVAEQFGVSVRTLHHYDEQGLLVPSERSRAGYRLYTDADLRRLAAIVTYRRLGFGLEQVREVLEGDEALTVHLRRQRGVVQQRLGELTELAAAIDRALEDQMTDRPATTEDLKELFGDGFSDDYQAEAEQRWGETDAWKQSAARTKRYTKADWAAMKAEAEAAGLAMIAAMRAGLPATSIEAMDAAEAHRAHIERWFYDLDHEFHRTLGDMYLADPRFTKTYEDQAEGLARYTRDAIHANADRRRQAG